MPSYFLLFPIVLPILGSLFILAKPLAASSVRRNWFIGALVLANSLLVWLLILFPPQQSLVPVYFAHGLSIGLKLDHLGMIFAGLIATMWPLASLYAFSYMKHKGTRANRFFMFYTMTYGAVLGVAFSENLLTMYVFYELLTFITLPLVMHGQTRKAVHAGRKYLYYMLGGSAFAFIGMIFIIVYGSSTDFIAGGVLSAFSGNKNLLLIAYVLTFCGFGVKAAIFPVHSWLPSASVAPTPVTALLHAVAVVKAGVFAIMRATYFSFGADFLAGSWAQYAVMGLAAFSIVYGSSLALKEPHVKRRLAYSTVGNLSYILFGVTLMTPVGLAAALAHMLAHAVMKICAFFCCGLITEKTGREYIYEMDGLGRKFPLTFVCFAISALALTGIPPFVGFVSKWQLGMAAVAEGSLPALLGAGALLLSALLTAMYMLPIIIRAFFPRQGTMLPEGEKPDAAMCVPISVFALLSLVLGVWGAPLINITVQAVANLL